MLNCRVPELAPFTALTVNVEVPALVGVPEIVPVLALSESPAGSDPELTDQVTPEVPDARVAVYDVPTLPDGREVVVMLIASA